MKVSSNTRLMKSKKIKTSLLKKAKPISILIPTDQTDYRSIKTGLMPNLIHSLDASSLCLSVNMVSQHKKNQSEVFNFFGIHDCFAVTCNNVSNLIKIIKLVYIKIYSEDSYLKRFDQGIINSIKLQFGSESFDDQTKKIKVNGYNFDYPNVDEVIVGKIKANNIFNANYIIK